jgi:acylpyruvate hydrolase
MSAGLGRFAGTKIVAVAKNYAKHKVEMGGTPAKLEVPAVFLKPASSVVAVGGSIVRPNAVKDLHHEVELGVVIGERCRKVKAADWAKYVSSYVVALDMTARDHQAVAKRDGMPWTLGKCWDTFSAVSEPVPAGRIKDPHALELYLSVNSAERQRGSTGDMLARIPELVEYISGVMTLEKGDMIFTGTPEGVGPVKPGDVITAGIKGYAEITVPVVAEE